MEGYRWLRTNHPLRKTISVIPATKNMAIKFQKSG